MPQWIDFKAIRASLRFVDVLKTYNVEVKIKGNKATGLCPLPTHPGKRGSPSFSVNLERGIWQCFGCGAKGNVLDFACHMEGFNPADTAQLRQGAITVQNRFGIADETERDKQAVRQRSAINKPRLVNPPLDFQLQGLDQNHLYFNKHGFAKATITHFGLGYCSRGMLAGRVAVPLHDAMGNLIGYAGHIVDKKTITADNPEYAFPKDRERNGVIHMFRKALVLYNLHRLPAPVDELVIVEDPASAWWLWQAGFKNTVALMWPKCSPEQAELILATMTRKGRIWLMPNGDGQDRICAEDTLTRLFDRHFVRWVRIDSKQRPTDYPTEKLRAIFN